MHLTHKLGNLRIEDEGKTVTVSGWINSKRNLGELIFIDLRDVTGISQVVAYKEHKQYEIINNLKNEYVIKVVGKVRKRSNINNEIPTGQVEILLEEIEIVNEAKQTPLLIQDETDALVDTRLDYRYLDIRRTPILNNLKTRHQITRSIRSFLDKNNFIEIETPILTKSTPEGARDYLVPSRVNKETMYALPQSPQLYKNLLMVGGVDRYYQIAKCFRDEDLRSDRQPEFTQLDIEMSFMDQDEIMEISEKMLKEVVYKIVNKDLQEPFKILDYNDAMRDYGTDKPDIRFDLKLKDVTSIFSNSDFKVFANSKTIKMINIEDGANSFSRKDITKLEEVVKKHNAKGLAWLKWEEDEFRGPIAKFLNDIEFDNLKSIQGLKRNDLLLFVADETEIVNQSLAALRNHLGNILNLYKKEDLAFLWVVNWPMFEFDKDLNRYVTLHHPFTMPKNNKFNLEKPLDTKAYAYDIVLNGYELGGGSIRINKPSIQKEMFELLGMKKEEYTKDFGFLLEAYEYGAPMHGGIALGLDRMVMLLVGEDSIRDVMAFPKNAKAREQMISSPSNVAQEQLEELNIKWSNKDNEKL